ncbi:GntR family transcriptional regulator [Streptomyces angustmyceticus]|uniref:GntR family transcriptional regulator n=1 Tax=Streptomyces angustmyceticus TaxID=285578 RepID=UPI003D8E710A
MSTQKQTADASAATRRALRADQLSLRRLGGEKAAASSAAVFDAHDGVDRHTGPWLLLAERRRQDAAGSPADAARWDRLIAAAARRAPTDLSYESLVVRVGSARDLLRALAETLSPKVPVVEVARSIKQRITSGAYPPGAALAPGRVAVDLGVPLQSVQLALSDLADSGVVEWQANSNCRARVPGAHRCGDRTRQIAQLLRALITGGVYRPGTALPGRQELGRKLVAPPQQLIIAARLLEKEGLLERDDRRRLIVRPDAVERTSSPQLPEPTRNGKSLRHDEIKEAAGKVRRWWVTRGSPAPAALEQVIDQLGVAAHQLVDRARYGALAPSTTDEELESLIARTAITAAAVHQPSFEPRQWVAACLAASLLDLQTLVDQGADSRPVSSRACLQMVSGGGSWSGDTSP